MSDAVTFTLPRDMVEAIAAQAAAALAPQVARVVRQQLEADASPYLTAEEAADYIRASSKGRIYDLVQQGRLTPSAQDGKRFLFTRATLDAYLLGGSQNGGSR